MAEQLIRFIRGEIDKLNDPDHIVSTSFVEKYPDFQNHGLLDDDIITWIKKFYPDMEVHYIQVKSRFTCINANIEGFKLVSIFHQHLYAIYTHNKIVETYDTSGWQRTKNNCSLYAGLALILRPAVNNMHECFELLKLLWDKQDTPSCKRLAYISKYYFGRDITNFVYPPSSPTDKPK